MQRIRWTLAGALALALGLGQSGMLYAAGRDGLQLPQEKTRLRNPIVPHGNVPPASLQQSVAVPFVVGPPVNDAADPWMLYHDGNYYLTYTATTDNGAAPLRIRKASTMGGLADAEAQVLWPRPGDPVPVGADVNMWAPEIHRLQSPEDGGYHFYVYYSPGAFPLKTMAVLESVGDDPLGPYHYKAAIPINYQGVVRDDPIRDSGYQDPVEAALDATVFTNHDGRLYYIYSGVPFRPEGLKWQSLYLAEMENPWTLKSEPVLISTPTYPWEMAGTPTNEGPVVLRRNGKLHVIYSAGACATDAYSLGRLSVDETADLLDPLTWLTAKHPLPVFKSSPQNGIYSPGHNSFVQSPDGSEHWIVYHAHTAPTSFVAGGGCGGIRTAHAQRFTFDDNGIPVFGEPVPVSMDLQAPAGDPTLNYQFEDAVIEAAPVDAYSVVGDEELQGDRQLIGLRALHFAATGHGESMTFRFEVPADGSYSVYLRSKTGPDRGAFRVELGRVGGPAPRQLGGVVDTYAEQPGTAETDLGRTHLLAGDYLLRVVSTAANPASSGSALTLDQVRFLVHAPGQQPQ